MHRRHFLLATGSALTAAASARAAGAGDRVRLGVVGTGGRGQLLTATAKEAGAEIAAVCDIYEKNLQEGLKLASSGAKPYSDYRLLLADKSLDAVMVATPDHWHSRITIDALEAGKDVYVEKPLAHTIEQGFDMVRAVRRNKRILQVGTQRRSFPLFQEARAIMTSGQVGDVALVTSWWMNSQQSLSQARFEGKIDWKTWLGSAPDRPPDPLRFFNWYHFWDYSGGMLVGQAAHIIDAIQWLIGAGEPAAVSCVAPAPRIPGAEVPETAVLTVEFPGNRIATFAISYSAMRYHRFNDQLKQFHGARARFDVGREWFTVIPQTREMELKVSAEKRDPGGFGRADAAHILNFLDCVRSRKEPNAPVEGGQATNIVLCMAMQSMRQHRRLTWNAAAHKVEG